MKHNHFLLSWCDLLLNLSVAFIAIAMVAIVMMAVAKKTHDVDYKAKAMVIMDWDPNSSDDIDLWMLTPEPAKVGFSAPNDRIANLERDDLGKSFNYYKDDAGITHYQTMNREIITLREKMDGHYVVDTYFYSRHADPETRVTSTGPVTVTLQLIQIDPEYKELATKTVVLNDVRDDRTAFTFDIDNGVIGDVRTDLDEPFLGTDSEGPQ